jgi:hypothetical protein
MTIVFTATGLWAPQSDLDGSHFMSVCGNLRRQSLYFFTIRPRISWALLKAVSSSFFAKSMFFWQQGSLPDGSRKFNEELSTYA